MSAPAGTKTILLIDDDEDFREPMEIVLQARGYQVRCAGDGDEGLRMAAEEPPDLILLDFLMPGKNGFETSQELAASPPLAAVPVLALTSFGKSAMDYYDPSGQESAGNICGFLEKPIDFEDLLARVADALDGDGRAARHQA
ncbi:MAG: response regulator [Planctomycetota bacterium]